MLDRPVSRSGWEARAAALALEGRASLDGHYVAALSGKTFARSLATPFGGFKQSGFGRARSPHAIDRYTDLRTIWTAYT